MRLWFLSWLVATVLVTAGAYAIGSAHAEATCSAGICFAELEGLLWAAFALPLCLVGWVADGVRRARR